MSLASIIANGVALAHKITNDGGLQASVTLEQWTGTDGFSKDTFASGVVYPAIVEKKDLLRDTSADQDVVVEHVITFICPITNNGATGRREPIDARDRLTLPDGQSGLILDVQTVLNPSTGKGFYQQVTLGRKATKGQVA
jgi:hypothetical protein